MRHAIERPRPAVGNDPVAPGDRSHVYGDDKAAVEAELERTDHYLQLASETAGAEDQPEIYLRKAEVTALKAQALALLAIANQT